MKKERKKRGQIKRAIEKRTKDTLEARGKRAKRANEKKANEKKSN